VLERKDAISHIKKTKLYFGSKFFEDKTLILIIALDYSSSKRGIQRVQALTDISRSALCCHSNITRAPIANPPNSAQLDNTYHSPMLHPDNPGQCSSVGMRRGTDRQIDTDTHTNGRDKYTFYLGYTSCDM